MKKITIISSLIISLIYISCKYDQLVPYQAPTESDTCSSDSVYYAQTIGPLMNSSCGTSGCHDAATSASGVRLSDHFSTIQNVEIGNPESSDLYKSIKNNKMPPSKNNSLTTAQKELIYKWIKQGAKNNSCSDASDCNAFNMSYQNDIKPIIDIYCKGCHNSSNQQGGVDISTWSSLQPYITSGTFITSIEQNGSISPMPKGGAKLSQCKIDKINAWIIEGALNN